MLERVTFVTTTGTGPSPPPRPPPPPPPPPWPLGAVLGSPACQTAYPAIPAMISRKTPQINPRFFDLPEPGGGTPCSTGTRPSGSDSGVLVVVVIPTPFEKTK